MKRKIFTLVLAVALVASLALPAYAAEPVCKQFTWNCPTLDFICQLPCLNPCQKPCVPDTPEQEETPSVPEAPEQEETPSVPETPEQEEKPPVPETPEQEETPSVPEAPEQEETPEAEAMTQMEKSASELVNTYRAENGLEPLTISAKLSVKARINSQDMRDNGYFDHNSPTYGSPFDLMKSLGITYRTAGENIAMGYTSPEAVVSAWMNSPGHRANILSTSYTNMGIGFVDGYWTQWFIG